MNANAIIKKAADGTTRLAAQIGVGSKRHFMLMEYDYLTLKFSTDKPTLLHLGDYVEIENVGRYELTAPTRGELNKNTNGYDYEIRLEAQYWKFKNKLCKFLPQIGSNETSWTYTDTLPNHAQQILFNLRAQAYQRDDDGKETLIPGRRTFLYNGKEDWRIEWDDTVDTTKAVTIQYESKNIIDAIADIAEAYECEWWFEQNVLHFGKCQYGTTPVTLEVGKELVAISRSDSKETYATRIYAYGSDRNIASTYRKDLIFEAKGGGEATDENRLLQPDWFAKEILTQPTRTMLQGEDFDFEANAGYWREINGFNMPPEGRWETDSSGIGYMRYAKRDGDEWNEGELINITNNAKMVLRLSTFKPTVKIGKCENVKALRLYLRVVAFGYPTSHPDTDPSYEHLSAEIPYEEGATVTAQFGDLFIDDLPNGVYRLSVRLECHALYWHENPPTRARYEFNAVVKGNWKEVRFEPLIPQYSARNITIDVIDGKTGETKQTITGATMNAEYNGSQTIMLPAGATLPALTKYRLPELNRALVPAAYFTSKYAIFDKYQDITTNGIVNSRLMLPEVDEDGNPIKGYVDAFDFESEEEAVEDVVIFEDVYPSRVSKIIAIAQSDEYTTEQPEQDGSTTKQAYREYIFEDDLFTAERPFNRGDYLIDGAALQVTFQSGLLNGMTFDVELLEDNYHFQIKRDDTTKLPNEVIKPNPGDEFILHGFNIAMMSDTTIDYVGIAEQELLRKTREYIAKLNTDASTYQCTVSCDLAYEIEKDSPDGLYLGIGRSVNLIHPGYFKDGRISRVLGYEIPLDYAYDNPIFYVGETAKYSRIGAIEDKLDGIGNITGRLGSILGGSGSSTTGTGAGGPYVIQQIDATPPTDKNVYSALRARLEFALKTIAQTIKHMWTFLRGIRIGTFIAGQSGAQIDSAGNAEVESLHVRSWLKVQELIYNRLNAQEGETSFSDVGTIEQIATGDDGTQTATMRMRWDGDFTAFQPGDVVYGYVNKLDRADAKEFYKAWAWVKSVDRAANQLVLVAYPNSETPSGTNHPMTEGMVISRWGNNIEPTLQTYINPEYSAVIGKRGNTYINKRQRTFFISCDSGNLVELMGVNKPKLEPGNYGTILGIIPDGLLGEKTEELINKDQPYLFARGIIVQDLIRVGYEGVTTRTANYRGKWSAQTAASATDYYRSTPGMYDTVTWNGALWQCVATQTLEEPSDASAAWVKMTASLDDGKEVRIWTINPSANIVSVRKNEVRPERLSASVTLNSSDNATQLFTNNYDLLLAGAKIFYSTNGVTWQEFIIGQEEPLDLEDETGVIELEDSTDNDSILTVGGNDISTADIGDRIYFELRDADTGGVLHSTQVPVVKDGTDGITGDWTSYAFKQKDSKPDTPTDMEHTIPSDWQDAPTGTGKWWMSKATIDGTTQKPKTAWSEPVQCTAEDGKPGRYTDFKYKVCQDGLSPAVTDPTERHPTGWKDAPDAIARGYFLWMIQAEIDGDNKVIGTWSTPVRISGEKGEPGEPGKPGDNGRDGLMVYPAGYYDPNTTYSATSETAPVVMYNDNFYVLRRGATYKGAAQADDRNTPALEVANTSADSSRWILFDKFNAIFADIIMSDFAKLGSAVIYGDWMISQQGTRNGTASTEYQHFKDGSFEPNVAINFNTGELRLKNGVLANFAKLGSAVFYGDWMISQQGALTQNGATDFSSNQYTHFADGSFTPNVAINFKTGEMRTRGSFNGFISRTPFEITPDNIDAYTIKRTVPSNFPQNLDWRTLRLDLVGTRIHFKGDFATSHIRLYLPALTSTDDTYTAEQIEEARCYIGNIIIMENDSNASISVEGNRGGTMNVPIGDIVQFECKMVRGWNIGDSADLKEYIEWESLPSTKRTPI